MNVSDLSGNLATGDVQIVRFRTQEELMDAFAEETGIRIPQLSRGAYTFCSNFTHWVTNYDIYSKSLRDLCIMPPDPSFSLWQPYPAEELAAALSFISAPNKSTNASDGERSSTLGVEAWASKYGLEPAVLNRATTALSGGQRVLVNFAKADILSQRISKLILCSPLQWLHPRNFHYLEKLLAAYEDKYVRVLLLNGEPFPEGVAVNQATHNKVMLKPADKGMEKVMWSLQLQEAGVDFPPRKFPIECDRFRIRFRTKADCLTLSSPTLCYGENGIGKSTMARILSGCEPHVVGRFLLQTGVFSGKARLMLASTTEQLFGIAPRQHIDWTFRCDDHHRRQCHDLFDRMQSDVGHFLGNNPEMGNVGDRQSPNSIMQAKLALAAERLMSNPPLIILDEPGWGLSDCFAASFVECVCREALCRNIAVLIIAHTNEAYEPWINSRLYFTLDQNDRETVWLSKSSVSDVSAQTQSLEVD